MKVFITYSHEDREVVKGLREDLAALELTVWFDERLAGGQEWWDGILAEIRGCDLYVLAISPSSIESTPCLRELQYATELKRPIVPVIIVPTSPRYLPPEIGHAHCIYYTSDDRRASLYLARSVAAIPPETPLPDPLPAPPEIPLSPFVILHTKIAGDETLDRTQQLQVLDDLSALLDSPRVRADAVELLGLLRRRRDVLADIRDRADALLAKAPPDPIPVPVPVPPGLQWSRTFMWTMFLTSPLAFGLPQLVVGLVNVFRPSRRQQSVMLIVVGVLGFIAAVVFWNVVGGDA